MHTVERTGPVGHPGPGNIAARSPKTCCCWIDQVVAAVAPATPAGRHRSRRSTDRPVLRVVRGLAADASLDVIYIATPHPGHHGAARLCLEAGRAVLVEEPSSGHRGRETADLITLARQRGLFAMEAMWTRFSPLVREVAGLVRDGGIGRVTGVQADYAGAPRLRPGQPPVERGPRLRRPARPWGVPDLFGTMLLGEPADVRALSTPAPAGVDANTAVIARYPDGAVGLYHCRLLADHPGWPRSSGPAAYLTVGPPFYRPERFTAASRPTTRRPAPPG